MKLHHIIIVALMSSVKGGSDHNIGVSRPKREVRGRTLKVTTIISPPYTMIRDSDAREMYGYIPDLLKLIEHRLGITFDVRLVRDGRYGAYDNVTRTWSGMIGEILKRDANPTGDTGADMAAAALTVTAVRERVVDFLKPFQHVGLSVLVKKPAMEDSPGANFQVLAPFAPDLWAICVFAFLGVALVLWTMNKLNPYEWGGWYNAGGATAQQAETFNLSGSLWFAFTTLQWQGYERSPRSLASRVMGSFWCLFVTITIVTFIASMVTHLFWVNDKVPLAAPFQTIEEMVMSDFDYGSVKHGSTHRYLTEKARGEEFQVMKKYLESEHGKTNLVDTINDGVARARKGKYGFICESGFAKLIINTRPCDLMVAAHIEAPRSYGLAISHRIDFELADALHTAILELHEEGEILALEKKWYEDKSECWNVTKTKNDLSSNNPFLNKPVRITAKMFWGPLVLLLVGAILSLLIGGSEVLYYKYKGKYDPKNQPSNTTYLKPEEDGAI